MQNMMMNFYKKPSLNGKKEKKTPVKRGLTMKQMMNTVKVNDSSGYESPPKMANNFEDMNSNRMYSKTLDNNKFKGFSKTKQEMINDVLGTGRSEDTHTQQLESIKSDLNKYKLDDRFDDINRFEKFLNEDKPITNDEEDMMDDDPYGDEEYLYQSEPLKKIEDMTMEERNEYFEEKKRKKKRKTRRRT